MLSERFRLGLLAASTTDVMLAGNWKASSLPVLTSHYGLSDERLAEAGVTRGMLRLSVGFEGANDLVADLEQALE